MINQKKICLLGDFSVGKTSLIRRFVENKFSDAYLSTIGVKISRKRLLRNGLPFNFLIWDLASGEDFQERGVSYLRGTVGAIIVCDLTRPKTILTLDTYLDMLDRVSPQATIILAANKVDLKIERQIDNAELEAFCGRTNSSYLLTSAKTGENVEEVFERMADLLADGRL